MINPMIVNELIKKDDAYNVLNLVRDNISFDLNISTVDTCIKGEDIVAISNPIKLVINKKINIYLNSIRDYKSLIFDLLFFMQSSAAHSMQSIITESGYCIREYYIDPEKEYIVWEISNNQLYIGKSNKIYFKSNKLKEALLNIFNFGDDFNVAVNFLEYSPFYSEDTGDFDYKGLIDCDISVAEEIGEHDITVLKALSKGFK